MKTSKWIMAWNDPDKNTGKESDPWSGGHKPQGPPDLDQALRNLQKKLGRLFNRGNLGSANTSIPQGTGAIIAISLIAILVLWLLSGLFIVAPAERAVILRFGKYVKTVGSGPHWIPRLVESVYVVNEQKISTYSYDAQMLTKDANIVSVAIAIQYRINNAKDFLFNVVNPHESLQQATASALRQVIGHTPLDLVLTSDRDQIRRDVKEQLDKTLQRYSAGILITDVAIQPAKAPDDVKEAFDDAIKAQEDEQRFENQAQAYAMQIEPIAKGQAQRLLADAQAYKQQAVLLAKGEIARYLALLPEYQRSQTVTRERLYLETIESILQKNRKIFIDVAGGNNMLYLPLDKIMSSEKESRTTTATVPESVKVDASPNLQPEISNVNQPLRDIYRIKGGY